MLSSVVLMARKRDTPERQYHPRGELFSVDETWKERVRAELERRGWDQADLADQIPCSQATVTNLLKPAKDGGSKQSRYARRILQIFGWPDTTGPVIAVVPDDALRRIQRKWPQLSEDERNLVSAMVESLTAKR